MQKCAFRLDDITPDMNWNNFEAIKQLFFKYDITPLLGIVPDNKDVSLRVDKPKEDFWQRMRELQKSGWSIAQHGYCHIYETEKTGLLGLNPFSEFAGLPYEVQYEKLKKGKEILEENRIYTDIFMAPGHTYDKNTIQALGQNGFRFVTDGYSQSPYRMQGLTFIPCKMSGPGSIKGTETICLHLNSMREEQIQQLDKFIEQNRKLLCSYSALLQCSTVRNRTIMVILEEKKNLMLHQLKNHVAASTALQKYLQKTDANSKVAKLCKRILGFPMIPYYLLASGKGRKDHG